MDVRIYTDGACSGNPGVGGWSCILQVNTRSGWKRAIAHSGGYRLTTNNRMEIMAVIVGLRSIKNDKNTVNIFSDSQYVCDCQKTIMETTDFHRIKNGDLWKQLKEEIQRQSSVTFNWIKGHNDHPENEECDKMAVLESKKTDNPEDVPYEAAFKQMEARKKLEKEAASRYEKNPFKRTENESESAPEKKADEKKAGTPISIGTAITSMECHVILVLNGHKFLSDRVFDSLEEANKYKNEIMIGCKDCECYVTGESI